MDHKPGGPGRDADHGARNTTCESALSSSRLNNPLDNSCYSRLTSPELREIPALLEHRYRNGPEGFSYIAVTRRHMTAVLDNVVHNTWDSRIICAPKQYEQRDELLQAVYDPGHRLNQVWSKDEQPKRLAAARARIRQYANI